MFWKTGAGSPTKEEWNAMKKIVGFISEHKKLLIVLAVLAVAVVVWQVYAGRAQAAAAQAMQANVQTLTLQRGDLARTLSANGSVQSGNAAQAATKLTYPVSEVLVKVGDTVAEGDVVARLDTTDLDEQIKNLQAALSAEKQQSDLAVAQAQRRVEDARNQKKVYEDRGDGDMGKDAWDDLMRQASLSIEDAQDALRNAMLAQSTPSATAQNLKDLKRQRSQCEITAPAAGGITEIQAVAGAPATNIASIEDPAALEIMAQVREYDVNQIQLGQAATFTSGAKDVFHGKVTFIAPKAELSASGEATYQVKFSVEDASDALRLGMTARAKIILEEKKGVFSVPLDTVGTSAEGGAVVYAKRTGADGSAVFEPIPVTTGMETDLAVEISGEGLEEGMELRSLAEAGGMGAAMAAGAMAEG